jgi:hypothetical protein
MFGQGCGVARPMEDADDDKVTLVVDIVDGVVAGKADPQTGRKILSRRSGQRKTKQRVAIPLDLVDEARRGCLGSLDRNVEPDIGEIGLRRVGQAEGERFANSFLPRSTIRPASKFLTRPAATSVRPALISALSAANSSI